MKGSLRAAQDFQKVYRSGTRHYANSMTVFVLANASDRHRLGITASRKAIGNAVQRNRSKRLVREAFRATEALLSQLELKYDWVINSKQKLLTVSSKVAADEFARIVLSVSKDEAKQDERRMV